jgi:hypothetical protein
MSDNKPTPAAAPIDPEIKKLIEDTEKLRRGVADVTLAWGHVENSLVTLLAGVLREDGAAITSAMYFSLTGLESRLRLMDSAMVQFAEMNAAHDEIIAVWANIMSALNRLRKTRNKVAHGQIVTHNAGAPSRSCVRLTSPIFDFKSSILAYEKGQLPGIGSDDLQTSCLAVGKIINKLQSFHEIVRLMHAGGDSSPLRKKLAELKVEPPNPDNPDNPNPPAPSAPPLS